MKNQTVGAYLDTLADKTPTPGGGVVAAITGAQAAALISMVCRLTRAEDTSTAITEIQQKSDRARLRFVELGEEDIAVFSKVINAYERPKISPQEKKTRAQELQSAFRAAALPQLETLNLASSLTPDIIQLAESGNQNLRTDIAIAAILVSSTILAARLNVLINLKSMTDEFFKAGANQKISSALKISKVLEDIVTGIGQTLE